MTILASLEVEEALKFLLHFGFLSGYLMYDALTNLITHYIPTRDPNCLVSRVYYMKRVCPL